MARAWFRRIAAFARMVAVDVGKRDLVTFDRVLAGDVLYALVLDAAGVIRREGNRPRSHHRVRWELRSLWNLHIVSGQRRRVAAEILRCSGEASQRQCDRGRQREREVMAHGYIPPRAVLAGLCRMRQTRGETSGGTPSQQGWVRQRT